MKLITKFQANAKIKNNLGKLRGQDILLSTTALCPGPSATPGVNIIKLFSFITDDKG
jgi:hypothetical protein